MAIALYFLTIYIFFGSNGSDANPYFSEVQCGEPGARLLRPALSQSVPDLT